MTQHAFIDMRGTLIYAARQTRLQEVRDAIASHNNQLAGIEKETSSSPDKAKRVAFRQRAKASLEAELSVLYRCVLITFPAQNSFKSESFYACLRPGAKRMLSSLYAQGVTNHILTDWDQQAAQCVINTLGMGQYLQGGIWSSREDAPKPPQVIKTRDCWVLADKMHTGRKLAALGLPKVRDEEHEEHEELTKEQRERHLIYTSVYDVSDNSDKAMLDLGKAILEKLEAQQKTPSLGI